MIWNTPPNLVSNENVLVIALWNLEQIFSAIYLPTGCHVFFRHFLAGVNSDDPDHQLLLLFFKSATPPRVSLRETFHPVSANESICIFHVAVFGFSSSGSIRSVTDADRAAMLDLFSLYVSNLHNHCILTYSL